MELLLSGKLAKWLKMSSVVPMRSLNCWYLLTSTYTSAKAPVVLHQRNSREKRAMRMHLLQCFIQLAMQRILGREGGYPDFHKLRDEIIRAYGTHAWC
jgi:hypothetical protein